MPDLGTAVIVVGSIGTIATAAASGASSVEKFTKEGRELLAKVLGPWAEAIGEGLGAERRARNASDLLEKAFEQLAKAGVEKCEIHPRFFMKVLEDGSWEDDDYLRSRWANLLASAGSGDGGTLPSFAAILAELSSEEVKILECFGARYYPVRRGRRSPTPNKRTALSTLEMAQFGVDQKRGRVLMDNLIRLGLCEAYGRDLKRELGMMSRKLKNDLRGQLDPEVIVEQLHKTLDPFVDQSRVETIKITRLGREFVNACRGPAPELPAD